jgi:hypothetical protein
MKRLRQYNLIVFLMVAVLLQAAIAAAGVIAPVATGGTPVVISNPPFTVSILNSAGADITDTWLPEPNQTVTIVVKNNQGTVVSNPTLALVPPPANVVFDGLTNPFLNTTILTTSAYPGTCTNTGPTSDVTPDFTLTGNSLTSRDCGGMAVLLVTPTGSPTLTFILPQDSNANGMPDVWESKYGGSLVATAEIDAGLGTQIGDGFNNFDEYRGFMVSGTHLRTDPKQKDLFVHLVNPQCGTDSLLGGGSVTYVSGPALFTNLNKLISDTQIHALGFTQNANNYLTTEWVDSFRSYSSTGGLVWTLPSGATTNIEPQTDRQVNANAIFPVRDNVTGLKIQKGLRIIECVDTIVSSPLGYAGTGTPNTFGGDNAILWTNRIVASLDSLGANSGPLFWVTYTSTGTQTAALSITRTELIAKAIEYYLAMEVGHSVNLTPTIEGNKTTSYGYHHAPGTGSNLDLNFTNKLARTGNTFYIPSVYSNADQSSFKLKD